MVWSPVLWIPIGSPRNERGLGFLRGDPGSPFESQTTRRKLLSFGCCKSWTHFPAVVGVNSPDKQGWITVGHSCMILLGSLSMMFWIWQFSNKTQGHFDRKQILGNHFWERFLGSLSSCLNLLELHPLFWGRITRLDNFLFSWKKLQLLRCQKYSFLKLQ